MKGYESKRREGEGMKSGGKGKVLSHNNKHMYGVNTMSESYDMSKVKVMPQELRGYSREAWDYKY